MIEFLLEAIQGIIIGLGITAIFFFAAYALEAGKHLARRKMRVCDVCFNRIKKLDSE